MSLFGRSFCAGALAGLLVSTAFRPFGCFCTPSFFGGFGCCSSIWNFGGCGMSSGLSYWVA